MVSNIYSILRKYTHLGFYCYAKNVMNNYIIYYELLFKIQ